MKKTISTIFSMCLFLFLFQNCGNNNTEKEQNKSITELTKSDTLKNEENNISYSIKVEVIDSLKYYSIKLNSKVISKNLIKITDINEAKKLLKGIVEFEDNKDSGAIYVVNKIYFRNGKIYENNKFDFCSFIAYFPEEDILLCEGGHTIDVSFNLKNGKETEETGNPDYIETSPNRLFRLNGHYGGQQCYSYFIQKKIKNEYVKIIQLDKESVKQTRIWLCVVGNSFWQDDMTLYLTEESDYTENRLNKRYFKIKLIEP